MLDAWPAAGLAPGAVYLSCGDSAATDIPDRTVDAVVTDPPFYDNVHYSELADFFHVWQRIWFGETVSGFDRNDPRPAARYRTRSRRVSPEKLQGVFAECHRVLKDEGLLVFSYHHSREDGWTSVAAAVLEAGFKLVQTQPVKAEMSVAMPKLAAKSPIDLDVLMVCRKAAADRRPLVAVETAMRTAGGGGGEGAALQRHRAAAIAERCANRRYSQALVELCAGAAPAEVLAVLRGSAGPMRGDLAAASMPGRTSHP